jgi:PmbA protein
VEALLELARARSQQAEIYSLDETTDEVSFENGRLKEIQSRDQAGISLRLIREGRLGFAYTKNLLDREELLRQAFDSLEGGVEALFDLPVPAPLPSLHTWDPALDELTNVHIVEECERVCQRLRRDTEAQINLSAGRRKATVRVLNSRGADLASTSSLYYLEVQLLYPGSYASIHRLLLGKRFEPAPEAYLTFLLDLYNNARVEVQPKGGRMKVLFLPETLYALMWRIQSAASGKNLYQKISPLGGRVGEAVFDSKLTVFDDPLNDRLPGSRAFDDEGTPCGRLSLVEEGVFKAFYYDRHYARKMDAAPTGHGYKSSMWGGETVSFKPGPSLEHPAMAPGGTPFPELIRSMDRGIVVAGVLGAHSGNIQNGDFSVGLAPGLYVEAGEIRGHVKDAMVAGNIFETLKEVAAVEDTAYPASGGTFPALLLNNVSVAVKTG